MDRLKTLIREPALLIDFAETLVLIFVSLGLSLSNTQQTDITAIVVAGLGLAKAFTVHPFAPGAITDFGRAALVLAVGFGLNVPANTVTLMTTALGTLVTLVLTNRTTPVNDPRPLNQAGESALSVVGIVIIVLAVVALVAKALHAFHGLSLVWIIVLLVIGAAVFFFGRRTTV